MRWDVLSYSDMFNSATPWTVACQAPLSMAILQARTLEWVAVPSSRSSQPRDQTQVSCITGRFFTMWSTREALKEKRLLSKYDFPPGLSSFSVVLGAMSVQLLTMICSYFHPQGRGIECSRASGQDWVDLHGLGISGPVLSGFWQMDCSSVLREAVSCFWLFLFLLI